MGRKKIYSKDHIWVCKQEDMAVIGLSRYALQQLGQVVFLNLPEVGEQFAQGEIFGDIESIKNVSDLIFPLNGKVMKVNEGLMDTPEILDDDVEKSWLLQVRAESYPENFMDEDAYQKYVGQL